MPRRSLSLLAALVLLAPMVAMAWPACEMAESCPMAGAERLPACHGSAIQADDCCLVAAPQPAIEIVCAAPSLAPEIGVAVLAPAAAPALRAAALDQPPPAAGALYTLFRALLI